ncbi:MAG: hypothetical protein JWO80_5413 [Bryobacterales bacterium]|nr:hypothetical protein [Bryobacterales bacterium]
MILVTWRLRGSLRQKPRCASAAAVDRMLDRSAGEQLLLGEERYARVVRDALVRGEHEMGLYTLRAWVIQHNHVHVLMEPKAGTVYIAETLMDASELTSGRQFWERESYERVIRNTQECNEATHFVEHHPVRLGLVDRAADWEWSSAYVERAERKAEVEMLSLPFTSPCTRISARV